MKLSDFFTSEETPSQKEKRERKEYEDLYGIYSNYFDDHCDDYSKKPNMRIGLSFVFPKKKEVVYQGVAEIYGPNQFDDGSLWLYLNKQGHMLEIWNRNVFYKGKFIKKIKRENVPENILLSSSLYCYIEYNDLDNI